MRFALMLALLLVVTRSGFVVPAAWADDPTLAPAPSAAGALALDLAAASASVPVAPRDAGAEADEALRLFK